MAKIVLKRKKSDKDTYLVRNVKSAYGELEYDDSLLEEDQVVEPIEKTNEEIIIVYSYESEWQEAQGANPEVL